MQKHLFILILITLCCACAQQKLERTSDLSHKRKLLLELAQNTITQKWVCSLILKELWQ